MSKLTAIRFDQLPLNLASAGQRQGHAQARVFRRSELRVLQEFEQDLTSITT